MADTPTPGLHIATTARDVVSGIREEILYPCTPGTPVPPEIPNLSHESALALMILRTTDAEWVRVARFDLPGEQSQFLAITDQLSELADALREAGREIRHGDVYEADSVGLSETDDKDTVTTKAAASRQTRVGVDEAVTRAVLERPEVARFAGHLASLQEAIEAREAPDAAPDAPSVPSAQA